MVGRVSVATNSVLRRILEEVMDGESPADLGTPERTLRADQLLELRRTRTVNRPPFATSLHFWAHALRAFLAERGRVDAFEALAASCLCDATDEPALAPALAALGARVDAQLSPDSYRMGYRMIDQDVLVSWVAESEDEFLAVFWTHPGWLSEARPIEQPPGES